MEIVHLSQLLSATGGTGALLGPDDPVFARVCLDSRQVQPGEVFWALKGPHHDGHDHVEEAQRRGALACVVERGRAADYSGSVVLVDHTLTALGEFAHWYRQQREALIIGVTGSVGKTTTREMIHAALSADHRGIRSQHNFNNEIGVPLTLLELTGEHDFAVLEMGARQVGDIRSLARISSPEVGVITSIGPAHLETFGSLEQVWRGKGELFECLPASGFAILPGDDPRTRSLAERAACPVILVGQRAHNQVRATQVEVAAMNLRFNVNGFRYEVPVAGRHALSAALCAVAIGLEIGMTAEAIVHGLQSFVPAPGRCRVEQFGSWTVINDTYNSNPSSMQAACEMLQDWPGAQKKVLIMGDMLELGKHAGNYHRQAGEQAARARIDRLIAFGAHAAHVVQGAWEAGLDSHRVAECSALDALLTVLDCWLSQGDVILVKGSRGMEMERVVEWLRLRSQDDNTNQPARQLGRACA